MKQFTRVNQFTACLHLDSDLAMPNRLKIAVFSNLY